MSNKINQNIRGKQRSTSHDNNSRSSDESIKNITNTDDYKKHIEFYDFIIFTPETRAVNLNLLLIAYSILELVKMSDIINKRR